MFTRTALFCAALAASTAAVAADSDIDTSFGIFSTGHNVVPINGGGTNSDYVADVLTAGDGSLYLVGTSATAGGENRITLVHLDANGTVDLDFGTNGRYVGPAATYNTQAAAAAFDSNGDIIVAGTRRIDPNNTDFIVCKFHGAGVKQFTGTGTACVTVPFDLGGTLQDTARDIALLSDGRIVLVGSANSALGGYNKAAYVVLNADGTPDTGFGPGGKRSWLNNGLHEENLYGVGVTAGNVLIAVGDMRIDGNTNPGVLVEKFGADAGNHLATSYGYLDTATGPAYFRDVSVRGTEWVAVGGVMKNGKIRGLATKLLPGGDYDPSWASGGGYDELNGGDKAEFTKVVAQSDGKYLVAGTLLASGGAAQSLIVARYKANGSKDTSGFNLLMGYRSIDFQTPGVFDLGARLTLQSGRPVVAGSVDVSNGGTDVDFGVARLQNELLFHDSFGYSATDD